MRAVLLLYLFLVPLLSFSQARQKLLPVKKDRLWGYIDTSGRVVIEPQFEHAESFTGNFAIVRKNKRYGLINRKGALITAPGYDEIQVLNDTLVAVVTDSLWGVIDHSGKMVVPMECSQITPAGKELFFFNANGMTGVLSSSGKLIVPAQYETVLLAHKRFLFAKGGEKMALYNMQGNVLLPPGNDTISIHNDSIVMYKKDSLWGCMHVSGKQYFAPQWRDYDFISGRLVRVAGDSAWALYSLSRSALVCPPSYTDFYPYSEGHVVTQKGNLYGLMDMNGNETIPPMYHDIDHMSDEVLKMQLGGLWGISTVSGKVLREPTYTYIGNFTDNLARTWVGRKLGAINIHGQELVPAENDSLWLHSTIIKAFKTRGSDARIITVDENGYLVDDNTYANLKTLRIGYAYKPPAAPMRRAQQQLDSLLVNDFQWFYDRKKERWGMKNIKTQDTIIKPTFTHITILWNQGLTMVEKPMRMPISREVYGVGFTFSYTYGLIDNATGKFVVRPEYLELRPADANGMSDPYIRCLDASGRRGVVSLDGKEDFIAAVYVEGFRDGYARVCLYGKVRFTTPDDRSAAAPIDSLFNFNCRLNYGSALWSNNLRGKWFKCTETKEGEWIYVKSYSEIGPKKSHYHIAHPYYNKTAIAKKYDKWGVLDSALRPVIPFEHDYIDHFPNSDRKLFRVEKNAARYGYVDRNGNEVIGATMDQGMDFIEGRAAVRKKGKWGFIDTLGNLAVEAKYDAVRSYSEGIAAVKLKGKWGFIDKNGNLVAGHAYSMVGDFSEGMAWVKIKSKSGYIDESGTLVIPAAYSKCSKFSSGLAVVKSGTGYGVINMKGELIVKHRYDVISDYSEDGFAIVRRGNKWGIIDRQGKTRGKCRYKAVKAFSEGLAAVQKKKGWGYMDTAGKMVIEPKYYAAEGFRNGIAMVKMEGKTGFINTGGAFTVEPSFNKVQPYSEGLAYAKRKKETGFIDESGHFVLATRRQSFGGFSNGYALVSDTAKSFTYIDTKGRRITRKRFEQAKPFADSMACVRYKGKWGAIDMNGLGMIPYKYGELSSFSEGIAKFRVNTFYSVYDLKGARLISDDCDNIVYEGDNLFRVEKSDKIGYFDPKRGQWKWPLGR